VNKGAIKIVFAQEKAIIISTKKLVFNQEKAKKISVKKK
jgi:hypothetical protein